MNLDWVSLLMEWGPAVVVTLAAGIPMLMFHYLVKRWLQSKYAPEGSDDGNTQAATEAYDFTVDPQLLRFFARVDPQFRRAQVVGNSAGSTTPTPVFSDVAPDLMPVEPDSDLPADPTAVYRAPILNDEFKEETLRSANPRPNRTPVHAGPSPDKGDRKPEAPSPNHLPSEPDPQLIAFARVWFQLRPEDQQELLMLAQVKLTRQQQRSR